MALVESSLIAWVASSTSIRTNTITTGSFTPAANSLVVVATGCGNASGVTVTGITVTDSVSGTWTPLVHLTAGGQFADASVWVKDAGASPSAQTVTVTMAPSTVVDVGLVVRQFTGAAPAASQTGTTNKNTAAATISITPSTTGSQVVGAFGNAQSANRTANGSTTIYGQTSDSGGAGEGAFEATSLSTSGTPITLGYTATAGGDGLAVAEILPASTTVPPFMPVQPGGKAWRKKFRHRQQRIPPSVQNAPAVDVFTATANASFGGTKTVFPVLTAAATAQATFTRTRITLRSLTTAATAKAVFGGFVPQQFTSQPGQAVVGLMTPGQPGETVAASVTYNGTFTATATAAASFGGTKTALPAFTPAATAHASFTGTSSHFGHFTAVVNTNVFQTGTATHFKSLTSGITAQASFTGTGTHFPAFTSHATAQATFTRLRTTFGALTSNATATAVFSGKGTYFGVLSAVANPEVLFNASASDFRSFTSHATAQATFTRTRVQFRSLTAGITAHASFAGTPTHFAALTVHATAHAVFSGTATHISSLTARATAVLAVSAFKFVPPRPPKNLGGTVIPFTLSGTNSETPNALGGTVIPPNYGGGNVHSTLAGTATVNGNLAASALQVLRAGTVTVKTLSGTNSETPNNLAATATQVNYGGTNSSVANKSGNVTVNTLSGTNSETPNALGGTISGTDRGGTLTLANFGGGAVGWTMQNVNLNFAEFNDITLSVTITSNGSPLNLTGYTVNMLLKPSAGIVDSDGSVIKLSSGGGSPAITITSAINGQCTVAITHADVQNQTLGFYRIDAVDGSGNINTAIYGSITYTAL